MLHVLALGSTILQLAKHVEYFQFFNMVTIVSKGKVLKACLVILEIKYRPLWAHDKYSMELCPQALSFCFFFFRISNSNGISSKKSAICQFQKKNSEEKMIPGILKFWLGKYPLEFISTPEGSVLHRSILFIMA